MIKVLTWNEVPNNLGDMFTHLWLSSQNIEHEVTDSITHGNFIGSGSMLDNILGRRGYTIWGTGLAIDWTKYPGHEPGPLSITGNNILALRGNMTEKVLDEYTILGDPGLLVQDVVPDMAKTIDLLVAPHHEDKERMFDKYHKKAICVDMCSTDHLEVLKLFASARRVISSSLHGLVFADAYKVPRKWEWFNGVQGGGFKFYDYNSVLGKVEPGDWYMPPTSLVETTKWNIKTCFYEWFRNSDI